MSELSRSQIVDQLGRLGVASGSVLLVHTSFRAVRPVAGGPLGLIEALRTAVGPRGTLVMPSWSDDDDSPFEPMRSSAARNLGVVADQFWRDPAVRRADHAFSFAACGPKAAQILSDPLPIPPHIPASPVGRVHDLDGQVLLLGVGHESNTTIHLAEALAGVRYGLPHHVTVLQGGRPKRLDYFESDHCCQGFNQVDDWLRQRGLQREGSVGRTTARLVRSRDVVEVSLEHLHADSEAFLHSPGEGCTACDEARRNGEGR